MIIIFITKVLRFIYEKANNAFKRTKKKLAFSLRLLILANYIFVYSEVGAYMKIRFMQQADLEGAASP